MRAPDEKSDKIIVIGSFMGIALSLFFTAMWIAATVVHGSWNFGLDTLSELGGDVPSRCIFNVAAIVSGLLGIPFALALASHLVPRKLGILGGYVLAIASIGLIAVGLFPIDTGRAHTIASIFFFCMAGIAALLLLHPLAMRAGFVSAPFIATMILIVVSIAFLALTSVPLAEAITVSGLLLWILIMSVWMLHNRKNDSQRNFVSKREEDKPYAKEED